MKKNTAILHQEAEQALQSKGQVETEPGLHHFLSCMLQAQIQFHSEYDRALDLAKLDLQSNILINVLQKDLALEQQSLISKASLNNDNFCLGVGYVFEGSALGATILKKRLAAAGLDCPEYFGLISSNKKSRWPQFLSTLNTCEGQKDLLSGAVNAFNYIIARGESRS